MLTPIAHRGLWYPDLSKQNTSEALNAALDAGYGVEFDLRHDPDQGCLVLAHDPVAEYSLHPAAEPWLASLPKHDFPPLLVNIKEAGTEASIVQLLAGLGLLNRAFLFDFGLCGADPRAAKAAAPDVRLLRRVSDHNEFVEQYQLPEPGGDLWSGTWLDQWDSDWATADVITELRQYGPVFLVGPDLHGRLFDLARLADWQGADGICTDIPHLLWPILSGQPEVHPRDAWWT